MPSGTSTPRCAALTSDSASDSSAVSQKPLHKHTLTACTATTNPGCLPSFLFFFKLRDFNFKLLVHCWPLENMSFPLVPRAESSPVLAPQPLPQTSPDPGASLQQAGASSLAFTSTMKLSESGVWVMVTGTKSCKTSWGWSCLTGG